MAGNAVIGALRVVLGADTAALEKGFKDAQGSLSSFGASAGKALAVVGSAIAGATVGIGGAIKLAIDKADELGKMAQKIGVPVEELSALKHAADLSGVSLETLSKGVGRLARNTVEAAQGLQTPVRAFEALGINIRNSEGKLKSVSELLPELADRFSKMRDGPEKTALSMQLLGRAGADLIPLLNMGKDGLKETMEEAKALGLVIDTKTAKAAEAFNDNLTRMGAIFSGIVTRITAEMLPAFQKMSQDMIDASKNTDLIKKVADGLVVALKGAVSIAITAGLVFQRLGAEINALWQVLMAPNWAQMKEAWSNFVSVGDETKAKFEGLKTYLGKFWDDVAIEAEKSGKSISQNFAPKIVNTTRNALQSFLDSTQKRMAAMQAEIQTMGLGTFAREKMRIALEAETVAKSHNIAVTESLRQKIAAIGEAYAAMADKIEGRRIWEGTRTAAEQFGQTMTDLNGKLQRGSIDQDTYARAVNQAQDKMVQASPVAQAFGQSLETAFGRAIENGAKFSEVLKGLLQDLSRALANQAFRTLLHGNASQGGTFGGILGTIFAGMPKFASGGSIMPGGSGMVDSQLVAFWKSPKEQVNIGTPGQLSGGGSSAPFNYYDNRTFNDVTPDVMAKIEARIRASIPVIKQQVIRELPKQRAANPNFYGGG